MKTAIRIVARNTASKRNPMAVLVRQEQFRKRVVRCKKAYTRNERNRKDWE